MFEYDPKKSDINKEKHGISFEGAMELWEDPERTIIPARTTNEKRYLLTGKLNHDFWSAIYTLRNKNIRLISVRKVRKNEREIYHSG